MRLLAKELIGYMHELLSHIRDEVCKVVVLVFEGVCSDPLVLGHLDDLTSKPELVQPVPRPLSVDVSVPRWGGAGSSRDHM